MHLSALLNEGAFAQLLHSSEAEPQSSRQSARGKSTGDKAGLPAFSGDIAGLLNTLFFFFFPKEMPFQPADNSLENGCVWHYLISYHEEVEESAGQSFCPSPVEGWKKTPTESRLLLLPQYGARSPAGHLGRRHMQMDAPAGCCPHVCLVLCTA